MKYLRHFLWGFCCLFSFAVLAQVDGKYYGTLKAGPGKIPLELSFSREKGSLSCFLHSPTQVKDSMMMKVNFSSADSIAVSLPMTSIKYTGHVYDDSICGIYTQSQFRFPLTFTKVRPQEKLRPQSPRPPFPYVSQVVHFPTRENGKIIFLEGTLTCPESNDAVHWPTVVMLTGSGPQNRDEEIYDHKPFAVIADYLARNGIASLRFDDRGTGHSKGNFSTATISDFTLDARAALEYCRMIQKSCVGVLGHSEGGTIALSLAAGDNAPDFVISLAGMVQSGKETVLEQNRRVLEQSGIDSVQVEAALRVIDKAFCQMIENPGIVPEISQIAYTVAPELSPEIVNSITAAVRPLANNEMFRKLLATDVSAELVNVKCPVLAINGTLDTQVSAEKNLEIIRKSVPQADIHLMPGLNHLMQHALTGDVSEYAEIEETISPEVLDLIVTFVKSVCK